MTVLFDSFEDVLSHNSPTLMDFMAECTDIVSKFLFKNCSQANDRVPNVLPHVNPCLSRMLVQGISSYPLFSQLDPFYHSRPGICCKIGKKVKKNPRGCASNLCPTQGALELCPQVCLLTMTVYLASCCVERSRQRSTLTRRHPQRKQRCEMKGCFACLKRNDVTVA